MKEKAAIYTGANKPFEIKEYDINEPQKGFAGLKMCASGICGTDIHIHTGRLSFSGPMIIGHEFTGTVDAISDEDSKIFNIKKGDNVIASVAVPCGKCKLCEEGDDANCLNMKCTYVEDPDINPHFFGGFANYLFSPVGNLIKVPKDINPVTVGVFACAGPTCLHAFHFARRGGCIIGAQSVAVVQGLGPVGTFAVMYLKSLGIKNIVAVTHSYNETREKLAKSLGATEVYSIQKSGTEKVYERIKELSSGMGADIVFEASGKPEAFAQGLEMLRNRGIYLVPGQYSNSGGVNIMPQLITFKALRIFGSSQYSLCDVREYVDFIVSNPDLHDSVRALAHTYSIEDINQAIEDATSGKNIKTMLVY